MAALTITAPVTVGPVTVGPGCAGCGACLLTCPRHAIRPVPAPGTGAGRTAAALLVLADRCDGCGECVEVCPVDAITIEGGP